MSDHQYSYLHDAHGVIVSGRGRSVDFLMGLPVADVHALTITGQFTKESFKGGTELQHYSDDAINHTE